MAPLNIHAEESVAPKRKKNKTLKILLGIGALVAIPVISTTLAGTVTINSNSSIQFGQGVVSTATCDDAITVSLDSAFLSGSFVLENINLSNLNTTPTSSEVGCGGKYLKIRAYNASNQLVVIDSAATTNTLIVFQIPTSGTTQPNPATSNTSAVTTITGWTSEQGAATDTLVLNINGTQPAAGSIAKITIESSTTA
jgi:hypothetical protein